MTETETRTTAESRMKHVDHTHPDTGRPFGEAVVFARGPTVAADGGEREAVEDESDDEETERKTKRKQMKDVDHKPPNETESNRVFERGNEGRDDTK